MECVTATFEEVVWRLLSASAVRPVREIRQENRGQNPSALQSKSDRGQIRHLEARPQWTL